MKIILTSILFLLINGLSGQQIDFDSINFYNDSLFVQNVVSKANGQIDFIEYKQRSGITTKIEFYDSKRRIKKEQIWKTDLISEIDYSYFEKDQIIKRYDVLNRIELAPKLNVYIKYPAMAREDQIEGIVEIALTYDKDCIPVAFEILNKLGHGINEEVEKKMNLIIHLSKKYNLPFDECQRSSENFKINFKLE